MASNRRGGIRKHHQRERRDRDGDLVMGAAPRVTSTSRHPPRSSNHSSTLTELRITGWTDKEEIPRLVQFLERHSSRRSPNIARGGGVPPTMVKRQKVVGDVLTIHVRPDDVVAFSKINGFSFTSTHGSQKLNIMGTGIRSKSPTDPSAPADKAGSAGSAETIELFKAFLERRYDAATKLLNLANVISDEEVAKSGMFETESRQKKFFPVLMAIVDRQLKTEEAKQEAIHSVTLSNNGLINLDVVNDLAFTLGHIKNLDLSSNKIASTKDLSRWKNKFRNLELLILTDNPIVISQPGWGQEITKWFPRLRSLNGEQVRSDTQIARLDMPKQTPAPCQNAIWKDEGGIAITFVRDFFPKFDSDRNELVNKYYDEHSTFTMNVNAKARGGAGKQHERTPWDSYLPLSRNLKFITGKVSRFRRKHRGTKAILSAWAQIPPTRHEGLFETNKYSMECHPCHGLPDINGIHNGVNGLMIIIHGEYDEHRTARGADEIARRAFDRTILLGPGGPAGVRVVSDLLSLRAAGGLAAWIPRGPEDLPADVPAPVMAPAAAVLTPEQEAMIVHVCTQTNLKREVAIQCLQTGNWNLETAAALFIANKDALPPDAFN